SQYGREIVAGVSIAVWICCKVGSTFRTYNSASISWLVTTPSGRAFATSTRGAAPLHQWRGLAPIRQRRGGGHPPEFIGAVRGVWGESPPAKARGYVSNLCLQYVSRKGALPDTPINIGDCRHFQLLHRQVK